MRNIVVAGGTKGIGKAIVQLLKDDNVFVIARSENGDEDAPNAQFIQGDVTATAIDLSSLPTEIHGLVYCPGSINLKPFQRLSEADFLTDWQINFMGAVRLIQALLPRLKAAQGAGIVLFSTVAVGTGMPFHASIAAAKAAVEALARSLAAELAPAIRVNCIAPSLTQTSLAEKLINSAEKLEAAAKRHPLQRIGEADDIAQMAVYLLSENAKWITGQTLHVDGGMSTLKV